MIRPSFAFCRRAWCHALLAAAVLGLMAGTVPPVRAQTAPPAASGSEASGSQTPDKTPDKTSAKPAADTPAPATRFPATGIAVIDCAPARPALAEDCVVRKPPLVGVNLSSSMADKLTTIRAGAADMPAGLHLSGTLLLIDRSPGLGGGRERYRTEGLDLIKQFVAAQPADEALGVGVFDEGGSLRLVSGFTTDHATVLAGIDSIEFGGVNTQIATNVIAAIKLMQAQKTIVLPNIVVFTDGEEEGLQIPGRVQKAAGAADVAVSSVGLFWRPEGDPIVGKAKDFLQTQVTTGDNGIGLFTSLPLGVTTLAETRMAQFARDFATGVSESYLIAQKGAPEAADLIVTITTPGVSGSGQTTQSTHKVMFVPASLRNAPAKAAEPEPEAPPPDLLFGYPRNSVYMAAAAAAVLALLLVALLVAFLRKGDGAGNGHEEEIVDPLEPVGIDDSAPIVVAPPPKPLAALMREDTRERLLIPEKGGTVGRAPTNDVVIPDDGISRFHAEFRRSGDGVVLMDVGSLNGTFVNEQQVTEPVPVQSGDLIRFGEIEARLSLL